MSVWSKIYLSECIWWFWMSQYQNERILPARSNYTHLCGSSNSAMQPTSSYYGCNLSSCKLKDGSYTRSCCDKMRTSRLKSVYWVLAVAFGVKVVQERAIVVGIPTSVCGRVVEVTYFETMFILKGALGVFKGLQKVSDGSTILDIFGPFCRIFVFILPAFHDLIATSNIIIIPPFVD